MPPPQTRPVVVPHRQAPAGTKEKLLSVRVPPGTPPGTTLHVSVPDEPGRILAAKVPPGNVSKFHVSYVPSEQFQYKRSMLPPASAYHNRSRDKSHRAEPSASHASVHNAEQHVNSVVEDVAPVGSWTDKFGF